MSAWVSGPIFIGASWAIATFVGVAIGVAITLEIVRERSTKEADSDGNARISIVREAARAALEKATSEANIAIAAARTQAEKAAAEAARAHTETEIATAEAARARTEAETAVADAARAHTEIENAAAETARARAEAEIVVAEAAKANRRAAELEREIALARQEKEKIKTSPGWRALPPTVVAQLVDALASKPSKVTIQYTNGDTEALYLALQLSNVFARANWQATMLGVTMQGKIMFGVIVPDSPSPSTGVIREALGSVNIEFVTVNLQPMAKESNGDTIDNAAVVFVGTKPLSP